MGPGQGLFLTRVTVQSTGRGQELWGAATAAGGLVWSRAAHTQTSSQSLGLPCRSGQGSRLGQGPSSPTRMLTHRGPTAALPLTVGQRGRGGQGSSTPGCGRAGRGHLLAQLPQSPGSPGHGAHPTLPPRAASTDRVGSVALVRNQKSGEAKWVRWDGLRSGRRDRTQVSNRIQSLCRVVSGRLLGRGPLGRSVSKAPPRLGASTPPPSPGSKPGSLNPA